jgi:GDP-4-dehydro-6-deoxy-D-mannose reductase
MIALVTGATGFVGPLLVRELLEARYRVRAFAKDPGPLPRQVPLIRRDLAHLRARTLRAMRPDVVFHLAAVSNVPFSKAHPRTTFEVNVLGTARLFRALEEARVRCRVVLVGSADVYASSAGPVTEHAPLRTTNPYSASKACAEAVARSRIRAGRDVVLLRPFNHLGPGQSTAFVAPAFADQIARAEAGVLPPVVRVGDLSPVRDFTDVRDIVRAYRLAAERARAGETYNICSDRGTTIRTLLDLLLENARRRIRVERDPSRARGEPHSRRVGCSAKFRRATRWAPRIPLRRTAADLLEHHREKVRRKKARR